MMRLILAAAAAAAVLAIGGQAAAATTSTGTPLLTKIKLHETDVMQSFARDDADGSYVFAQVSNREYGYTQAGNEARGDLTLTRVSSAGAVKSVMYLRNFGHGVSISAEVSGGSLYVWVEAKLPVYPAPDGHGYGSQVARVKWAAGAIRWPGSPGVQLFSPVPGADHVTPSLDAADGLMAVRYQDAAGAHVAVYPLAAFRARVFTPAAVYAEVAHPSTLQGWAVLPGGTAFALVTGEAVSTANPAPGDTYVTTWGAAGMTGQVQAVESTGEPEGAQVLATRPGQVCNGWATGPAGGKVASVYCRPVPAG